MNETLNEISPTLAWKPDAFANRQVIITGGGEELEATKAEFPTADIFTLSLGLHKGSCDKTQ